MAQEHSHFWQFLEVFNPNILAGPILSAACWYFFNLSVNEKHPSTAKLIGGIGLSGIMFICLAPIALHFFPQDPWLAFGLSVFASGGSVRLYRKALNSCVAIIEAFEVWGLHVFAVVKEEKD